MIGWLSVLDLPNERPFYQVGAVVPDLDAAREELSAALGLVWSEPRDFAIGPWSVRVCFAKDGPPWLELLEGSPGSPWDPAGGARLDHVGSWTDDLGGESDRLAAEGAAIELDARPYGATAIYHRLPLSGLRVELLGLAGRDGFFERWQLERPD
jgi:hypothetical protein